MYIMGRDHWLVGGVCLGQAGKEVGEGEERERKGGKEEGQRRGQTIRTTTTTTEEERPGTRVGKGGKRE